MTAQIPEHLILDGESFGMTFCPTIPEDHPRIAPWGRATSAVPDAVPVGPVPEPEPVGPELEPPGWDEVAADLPDWPDPAPEQDDPPVPDIVHSTACWRGYLGSWAVRDDRLSLLSIVGRYRLLGEEPLFADWFSGTLIVPVGELVQYVHMGFGSVYASEIHLRVERGVVVERRIYNHPGGPIDVEQLMWMNIPGLDDAPPDGEGW